MADAYATPSAAAQSFSRFLSWWQQQLKECVPLNLRNKMAQARRPAMWSPGDDRFWPAAATLAQSKPFLNSALALAAILTLGGKEALRAAVRKTRHEPLRIRAREFWGIVFGGEQLTLGASL